MKTKALVECKSLGIRTTEATARKLDRLVPTLPKECRTIKRKALSTDLDLLPGERTDISTINTAALDRDYEIVRPEGIELEEYQANPIVLWNHDYDVPIGKCLWVKRTEKGLVAKTQYPKRPKDFEGEWRIDSIFGLIQSGVLRAKSIGYLPLEIEQPGEDDPAECRAVTTRATLLEYSVVSVPANPEALLEAVSKGLGKSIFGEIKKVGHVSKLQPRRITEADILKRLNLDPDLIEQRVREALANWGRV